MMLPQAQAHALVLCQQRRRSFHLPTLFRISVGLTAMPAKSKAASMPKFPWDDLSASTLRNVCREIGCRVLLTKPNMIAFLEDVEENGVESAMGQVAAREAAKPSTDSPEPTTPRPRTVSLKRKKPENPAEEEPNPDGLPYNTRHKGQKRVCVTAEPLPRRTPVRKPRANATRTTTNTTSESISAGPALAADAPVKRGRGRPRKSAPTTSESAAVPSTSAAGAVPVKRGRGRPRKSAPDAQPPSKSTGTTSKKKEVFYGVVVSQRVRQYTEDDDADGEVDDDEDQVVILQNGETSSLGSSNKENYPEPLSPEVPPVTMEESLVDALNHAYGSTSQK